MSVTSFKINPADNVATLLGDAASEVATVLSGSDVVSIILSGPIGLGHKVALADIRTGEAIIKFGVSIGSASRPILRGEWVHLHNCRSNFDARSGTLDVHSGASTDIKYE